MDNFQVAIAGVKIASKVLKIEDINVEFLEKSYFPNPEINAVFLKENLTIVFNEDWIINTSFLEIMVAAFHEARHVYQYMQIAKPRIMKNKENAEVIKQWTVDFEKYVKPYSNPNSENDYFNQTVEIDAIAFSKFLLNKLFEVNVIIPEKIKDKVNSCVLNFETKHLI